ncbi:MAG: branched-chain amino acid ABC transporter permease [Oscillospiraceae bacterium]|nr:branched-chain amino acid ABC transporter permease [Oscillospiraceae bacterium]
MGGTKKSIGVSYIINTTLVVLLFFVLLIFINTGVIGRYNTQVLTLVCINIILAVSLNLVTGVLGQLVLGHAGFMLVGAYASALFTKNIGLPLSVSFPISLLLGGLLAALFGVVIGIPALRLRGDYLAIITLGFGEIIRVVSYNLEITNGAKALSGIKSLSNRQNPSPMFIYAFLIAVFIIVILFTFGRSRHGRAVISIREDEIASESMGINTIYYKLFVFVFAAFIAGVAGGIFAHNYGTIDPAKFDFNRSVEILIMVVLGGMGSITGSIISAGSLTILSEKLRDFSQYRMILYSVILIIVMLFRPSGLLGRYEISVPKILRYIKKRISNKKVPPEAREE